MKRHALLLLILFLTACSGGPQLIEEEQPIMTTAPIASNSDARLEAHLDWVIIRNGAGSWVTEADWDEYVLRFRNASDSPVRITSVELVDDTGQTIGSQVSRQALVKQTRQALRRYQDLDWEVQAGFGGDALMAAGGGVYLASTAVGVSVLAGSASVAAAPVALGGVLVVAPVLIGSGVAKAMRERRIAEKMTERSSYLPHMLITREHEIQTFFFPITPSPASVVIAYEINNTPATLALDVSAPLDRLHLPDPEAQ